MAFELALLNPLRFIDTSNTNAGFDGNFALKLLLSYQSPKCYFQKWQFNDTLKLQILADFEPTSVEFRELYTDALTGTANWAELPTLIQDQSFRVYELEYPFSLLPEGRYYAQFDYAELLENHVLISEPFDVRAVQDNTVLLKYKNSENDFDVIFDTGIEFTFRIEGAVKDYTPGTDRNVYTDQQYNPTSLSAVPYRKFKFYIGYGSGVAEWAFDKVVRIQATDQVSYDNIPYQVSEGADYEIESGDNGFIGGSIQVQPIDNKFKRYISTDPDQVQTFTPMQKVIAYYNQSGNLVIAGKFRNFSLLEKICISKRSGPSLDMSVGTSLDGQQIAAFTVDFPENVFTMEWYFSAATTVYLGGLTGADVDVFLIYKQMDEAPVPITPGGGSSGIKIGKGTCAIYSEVVPGDLDIHWDASTGLGRANTDYAGWAWRDGRNGTQDMKNLSSIGFDRTNLSTVGNVTGSDSIIIARTNLPHERLSINTGDRRGRSDNANDRDVMVPGGDNESLKYTEYLGDGTPITYTPPARIEIPIQKITD
jgi:hypothetical protein